MGASTISDVLLVSVLVTACVPQRSTPPAPPAERDGPGDIDGDGVSDPGDRCPENAETRNGYEDEDGCPDEVPPPVAEPITILESIHFDADEHAITTNERPILDRTGAILNEHPTLMLEIVGHTDSHERSGAALSLRRAEGVKRYLIEKGVGGERLGVRGAGADEPIDTNETAVGRAKNRRIEFVILVAK